MIRNKILSRFIVVTLTAALLLVTGSRAIRVSALAQPDWAISSEFAPIFDTEIINIEDYMGSHLSDTQLDVFWLLLGVYVVAQGGSEEYKLRNPYANESGVVNWLKDCGIQLWNAMVGLNMTPIDPVTGVSWAELAKKAQDVAMGAAVKASSYDDMNDFLSDVEAKDKYLVPFMPDLQTALHYVFQRDGSLYNWQFDVGEFTSNVVYNQQVIPPTSTFWSFYETLDTPVVRINNNTYQHSNQSNLVISNTFFSTYSNILFNTTSNRLEFYSNEGLIAPQYYSITGRFVGAFTDNQSGFADSINAIFYGVRSYTLQSTWQDTVQYYVDHPELFDGEWEFFINDFVYHYYYGSSWSNKTEIFHNTDLNFDENTVPYYLQTQNDYLLDIKGIIQDLLLPTINLKDVFLNNIFDLEGVIVTDPVLIQVAKDILYEIQSQNVPLPVNLNDIADYTDNTYLDVVKDRAQRGGSELSALVAFWHNCDPEIIYVLFGAGITVLVGAFIGKWGHS